MKKDKADPPKQKPVPPKPPAPKPHEQFLAGNASGGKVKAQAHGKQRIIRHQGR